ncbi:hypothetical protein PybrP1_007377 [[Pythium] brassicae (nom. inval.)]|nr:hypothetical protein PybrP1_007377 [[Pythium] brassicae (nom. inval.)]
MKPAATALIAALALAQAALFSQTESAIASAVCPRMLRGSAAIEAADPQTEAGAKAGTSTNQEDEEMHKKHKIIIKKIAIPVPVPVEVPVPQYIEVPIPVAQPAAVVASSSNTVVSNTNVADTAVVAPGVAPGVPGVTPARTRMTNGDNPNFTNTLQNRWRRF